ncbi:MarR family winged helix-turn-helix transcriptional regulator [Brucella pituitosa]|uniref:MarR family winged helix-turn-helix transcriptional regulator n=1 Tax=Brucella pituitosa TaxID=571256 RepID=UPI000CFF7396|nr:hypothetical protein CQ062_22750 [Ochrobactrum sp. MYb68]
MQQDTSALSYYRLCIAVQRINRIISRRLDEVLRPPELTSQQMIVLGVIAQEKSIRLTAIAHSIGKDQATVTANLRPLIVRSLVHTTVDEENRRVRVAALTAEGEALHKRGRLMVEPFDSELMLQLGEPEVTNKLHNTLALFGGSGGILNE